MDSFFIQGYVDALKMAGLHVSGIPEGPGHLPVEQLTKFLRSGEYEKDLERTMVRSRPKDHGSSVTWGPKSPLDSGESHGNIGGIQPYGGV